MAQNCPKGRQGITFLVGGVELTFHAVEVLAQRVKAHDIALYGKSQAEDAPVPLFDSFQALRTWRTDVARQKQLPPYIVATDSRLRLIADAQPRTLEDLRAVKGILPGWVAMYGADVLRALGHDLEA